MDKRSSGIAGSGLPHVEEAGVNPLFSEKAVRDTFRRLTTGLIERGLSVTAMESCTGGQIASLITDTEGASAIMKGAFVTYSNEAKIRQGVPAQVIEAHGVYSAETAAAMAEGCRNAFSADIGIGVTGSFGNADPYNADSIPGEVFLAVAFHGGTSVRHLRLPPLSSRLLCKLCVADAVADLLGDCMAQGTLANHF